MDKSVSEISNIHTQEEILFACLLPTQFLVTDLFLIPILIYTNKCQNIQNPSKKLKEKNEVLIYIKPSNFRILNLYFPHEFSSDYE